MTPIILLVLSICTPYDYCEDSIPASWRGASALEECEAQRMKLLPYLDSQRVTLTCATE